MSEQHNSVQGKFMIGNPHGDSSSKDRCQTERLEEPGQDGLAAAVLNAYAMRLIDLVGNDRCSYKSEVLESLFTELSLKMWQGQIPSTSIAVIDELYEQSTGRLLKNDLREEDWPCYFSAFQLSIDLINNKHASTLE